MRYLTNLIRGNSESVYEEDIRCRKIQIFTAIIHGSFRKPFRAGHPAGANSAPNVDPPGSDDRFLQNEN